MRSLGKPGSYKQPHAASQVQSQIAQEQMFLNKHADAIALLTHSIDTFHREKWFSLCLPLQRNLFRCACELSSSPPSSAHATSASAFDIDSVGDRRSLIHSTIKLISLARTLDPELFFLSFFMHEVRGEGKPERKVVAAADAEVVHEALAGPH